MRNAVIVDAVRTARGKKKKGAFNAVHPQALAAHTLMFPTTEASSANFDAFLSMYLITHNFVTLEPFGSYMRRVRGGGSGPGYSFRMGRYEITNQQYADFLNAASLKKQV